MWRKGNFFALLEGMHTGAATVESSMEISQKIKNWSAFWPTNPASGNTFKGTQNTNLKEHKHLYVIAALSTVANIWKQPKYQSVDK